MPNDPSEHPPLYFVSFAGADRRDAKLRPRMDEFLGDLAARVAVSYPPPGYDNITFFSDRSIDVGHLWSADLEVALAKSMVGVCLYSNPFFTSQWCGKEFQVFRERAAPGTATGIIPLLWLPAPSFPKQVTTVQYKSEALPKEYAEVGIHGLLARSFYRDQYEEALDVIAKMIVQAATATPLRPLDAVSLDQTRSAWDVETSADDQSHTKGGIAKTCFVFVSKRGWDWVPYPNAPPPHCRSVGSLAQEISGQLGLRYEEIPCDANLSQKLKDTNRGKVPTVLMADPDSLGDERYAAPLRDYDDLYLLNCGLLVPWEARSQGDDADPRWGHLKNRVVTQKIAVPPPLHEWRSVFSHDEFERATRNVVERLRLRLLDQILTDAQPGTRAASAAEFAAAPDDSVRAAQNDSVVAAATRDGIDIRSTAQLEVPSK
jgi:hypothetical protein